ncbi:MAG: threonine--tRNA ligase [Armatimonadota bacterium]|jgi:threonyl-tRNA synthetase|nr:MAG: threonine--tRNA ligase [Armatimonadota bacterium]
MSRSNDSDYPVSTLRHSAAHVMAHAVKDLWPEVKIAIGPAIEDGFYYDFDKPEPFTPEDLEKIEARMREIIREARPFEYEEISRDKARELFADQPYKLEILEGISDGEKVTTYREGDFVDLCRGPHVEHAGQVKAFKLLSIAGAYWKGDSRNPMLQRIYGTAFHSEEELEEHLRRLEEARKRDHRKLGRELDLFSIQEDAGPGLVFWHPKGALVRKIIEDYWRDAHLAGGYDLVYTPHIARQDLWRTSGHLDFFSENMYQPMEVEGSPYLIKPMNCPFHLLIYKSRLRSYREMPIRWAELGTVYRYEPSGVLHGLMRVRGFTQDDAHILCRPDQLEEETVRVLDFVVSMLTRFGFTDYEVYLSTRPEKFVGTDEGWEKATEALRKALEARALQYEVDEGGGAFYGPKIDIKIRDAIGRVWQCSTIQVDFNEPERFDISYMDQENQAVRPIMIHRALLGSLERFMGVLIEHYAGAFPLWLAPVQAIVLPIADRHAPYAEQVREELEKAGFRVKVDMRNEKTGYKIREAQLQKIPYMLIVGDREVESGCVSVRSRDEGDLGSRPLAEFVGMAREALNP